MTTAPWSSEYWERRYAAGHNSGAGSYGALAEFKADVINRFVARNSVQTVIEFGCGDGAQLELADYRHYVGYDVSETVLDVCRRRFAHDQAKHFYHLTELDGSVADLTLSLDVIYHLIEDSVYEQHMRALFSKAARFVIIYSSNTDNNEGFYNTHVFHRKFTDWVDKNERDWTLSETIANIHQYDRMGRVGSFADFYIYRRSSPAQ